MISQKEMLDIIATEAVENYANQERKPRRKRRTKLMTQTKQAKHTGKLAYNHIAKVIVDEHGNCLASIHRSAQDEIGETIVRAVNSHEELLVALQRVQHDLDNPESIHPRARHTLSLATQQFVKEAIAHATGENL